MPRGQVLTIPNGQSVLTTTLSREQKASIALLNPNDGIVYVKLNGPAGLGPTMWDWKIPSQSYAQLPGPWQSLGAYYNDQSGSGRTAEINIYESDSQISLPSFIAIGRAVEAAGTTMDISQGAQPQSPPASTVRLWADGNGDLHTLSPSGHDETILTNESALGGNLYGTVPNGGVRIQNGSFIYGNNASGTQRNVYQPTGDNYNAFFCLDSGALLVNYNNTVRLWSIDNSGNMTMNNGWLKLSTGYLQVGSQAYVAQIGDIGVSRNSNAATGTVYFGNTGTYYLNFDGSNFVLRGGDGNIAQLWSQNCVMGNNNVGNVWWGGYASQAAITFDGSWMRLNATNGGLVLNQNNLFFNNNSSIGISMHGSRVGSMSNQFDATNYFANAFGYVFQVNDTNNALYWDNSSMMQITWIGDHVRLYSTSLGQYTDIQLVNNPDGVGTGWCTRFWGSCPNLYINQMIMWGGNGYFAHSNRGGAPSNEVMGVSHFYTPGSVWCTNVQNVSQRDLKTNIDTLNPGEALKLIADGRVKSYRFEWLNPVEGSNPANTFSFGFMADEMVQVCPEVVELATIDDETIPAAINYNQLVSVLWSAVRNLNDRIEQLELAA